MLNWPLFCRTISARRSGFLAAFLLGASAVPASAAAPLSVDDAVKLGFARNPQVKAAEAAYEAAAQTSRSLSAPAPLTLGLTRVRGSSAGPTLNGNTGDTFLDLNGDVDTSGQRRLGAASSRAQAEATGYQLLETRLTLSQQIRDAYWSLAAARAQLENAKENLEDARRVDELTNRQLAVGVAPALDTVRSRIAVANQEQALLAAEGVERGALVAFNALLDRPNFEDAALQDPLSESGGTWMKLASSKTPQTMSTEPTLGASELLSLAMRKRPLIRASEALVRSAQYALKQARASRGSDVTVDLERSLENPVQTIILGLRLPILDFGSIRGSIKAAEAAERQARLLLANNELQVRQQVGIAYSDYVQARALVSRFGVQILAPSATLLAKAQIGYDRGATGILPVLDAQSTLRAARSSYTATLLSLYRAEDEVLAATAAEAADLAPALQAR